MYALDSYDPAWFGYHPPRSAQRVTDHETVRSEVGAVARSLSRILPESPEAAMAVAKLREAMMWANAALALEPDPSAEVSPEDAAAGP